MLTDIIRVEFVKTDQGGDGCQSQAPLSSWTSKAKLALVDIVEQHLIEALGAKGERCGSIIRENCARGGSAGSKSRKGRHPAPGWAR